MNDDLHLNEAGNEIILWREGKCFTVYKDVAGNKTVGIGHRTTMPVGSVITDDTVHLYYANDVSFTEHFIKRVVTVKLTENQFSALVSLVFNIGPAAFMGSHMLKYINDRYFIQASDEFDKWDHSTGKVVNVLQESRRKEKELFLS